jgi:hypothetical protein
MVVDEDGETGARELARNLGPESASSTGDERYSTHR